MWLQEYTTDDGCHFDIIILEKKGLKNGKYCSFLKHKCILNWISVISIFCDLNPLSCLCIKWIFIKEKDIETRLTKAWIAINRLSIIWKSDLTDKMKRSFFQAAVTSILLYGCTTWTLTKRLEKKLDGNYTRMLRAILNKSWQQHPTRHQLYGHLPPITKTLQVRRTRHAGHCWRSRDELIRDVLLWIPTHGRAKVGRPAWTYIQQLCEDTGCCPEDLPRAMNDREEWRERVWDIRATSAIWWWWWYIYIIKMVNIEINIFLKIIHLLLTYVSSMLLPFFRGPVLFFFFLKRHPQGEQEKKQPAYWNSDLYINLIPHMKKILKVFRRKQLTCLKRT